MWGQGMGRVAGGKMDVLDPHLPSNCAGAFYILASRSSRTLQTQGAAAIMPECATIPALSISISLTFSP